MGTVSKQQREENIRMIEMVNQYKETRDDLVFAEISKALHSYLMHLSSRKFYRIPGHGPDDIYQEGLVALSTKAIMDYEEAKGPFLSFAKLCIFRHIITVLKSTNNTKNRALNGPGVVSLDAPAGGDDDNDDAVPISGIWPSSEGSVVDILERLEEHACLKKDLRARLTPLERKVLDLYLQNMSYADIVKVLNRRRRGKNKACSRQIDNGLCRVRSKSAKMLQELEKKRMLASAGLIPSKRNHEDLKCHKPNSF